MVRKIWKRVILTGIAVAGITVGGIWQEYILAEEKQPPQVVEVSGLDEFLAAVEAETHREEQEKEQEGQQSGEQKEKAEEQQNGKQEEKAEEQQNGKQEEKAEEQQAEVSVAAEMAEDDPEKSADSSKRRLLVAADQLPDDNGASTVICGYQNLYVLLYDTEKEADQAFEKFRKDKNILAEKDEIFAVSESTEKTAAVEKQLMQTGQMKKDGTAITVAVLDTGYDLAEGNTSRITGGISLTGERGMVQDANGHGTAMANIILQNTEDSIRVMPVKIADEKGYTSALKLYIGICQAAEAGADIINISMAAYRPSGAGLLEQAVHAAVEKGIFVTAAAGNAGKNVKDYCPANIEGVIAVSAADTNKVIAPYSNRGEQIRYAAYGTVRTTGLGGADMTISGTSASTAVVTAAVAACRGQNPDKTNNAILEVLDQAAEDLGTPGRDDCYGNGLLVPENYPVSEEEKQPENNETNETPVPELLTCAWKEMEDEKLSNLMAEVSYPELKQFLQQRTQEEREELLKRDTILSEPHLVILHDENGSETERRRTETLYEYLYSDAFEEFCTQYYIYNAGQTAKVLLATNINGKNAELSVYSPAIATQPVDDQVYLRGIRIEGTGTEIINLDHISFGGVQTFSDGKNVNVVGQYRIRNLKIKKGTGRHLKMKKSGKEYIYADWWKKQYESPTGVWTGGYTEADSLKNRDCGNKVTTADIMVGVWDFKPEHNGGRVQQKYTLLFEDGVLHTSEKTKIKQDPTCTKTGISEKTTTSTCEKCAGSFQKTEESELQPYGHSFPDFYKYADQNGIQNGIRYRECVRACEEEGWQTDFSYLNVVYKRLMDTDGNWGSYQVEGVNDYFAPGAAVMVSVGHTDVNGATEFLDTPGVTPYVAQAQAQFLYVDIPRKRYHVTFDGNGAHSGTMQTLQSVCCGKSYQLPACRFEKKGYQFAGWIRQDGTAAEYADGAAVQNLSLVHDSTVVLSAVWKPQVYEIHLDSQGGVHKELTETVYEKYGKSYLKQKESESQKELLFPQNKVNVPQKMIRDNSVDGLFRKMKFTGYYTRKNRQGHQMIRSDGSLIEDIGGRGKYRYFTEEATVYAGWENMYAIQYSDNLTAEQKEVLTSDLSGKKINYEVKIPDTVWKARGETVMISYEPSELVSERYQPFFRFKGYSLTPKISDDAELVLSETKKRMAFGKDQDVRLYAQWDTSFTVVYIGNGQTGGKDFTDEVAEITGMYQFDRNQAEEGDYFTRTEEKETMDIPTGNRKDEAGKCYMEEVEYELPGWSLYQEANVQRDYPVYWLDRMSGWKIIQEAYSLMKKENVSQNIGITFGKPGKGYHGEKVENLDEKHPYVNLYAVWDSHPQILASDLYFPLSYAKEGKLTEEFLLTCAEAVDEELISAANLAGTMKHGTDRRNKTVFEIQDYQSADFQTAGHDFSVSICYRAEDAIGSETTKMVMVHLTDTEGAAWNDVSVRFIAEEYKDTLSEKSVWLQGDYAAALDYAFRNKKQGQEYTTVSAAQAALGVKQVEKPGSGNYQYTDQIWRFDHDTVRAFKDYLRAEGNTVTHQEFLTRFGNCRVR